MTPVQEVILRAQTGILALQHADGSFHTSDESGPAITGMGLVGLAYLKALACVDASGAARFLLGRQLPSGAFPGYPGDKTGTLAASCACYAGLHVAGIDATSEPMRRAWAHIRDQGGFVSADVLTQTFLAAGGLIDPTCLPDIPMAWMLVPGARRLMGRLMIGPFHLLANALPGLLRGLRLRRKVPGAREDLRAWMENQNLISYLKKVQDPTGTWIATSLHTLLCAMTLHALGLPLTDPAIVRAIARVPDWCHRVDRCDGSGAELAQREALAGAAAPGGGAPSPDSEWQFSVFNSECWNTALCLGAVVQSGVPARDDRVRRAAAFLLTCQGRLDQPREWQNPRRGAPRQGGWAFEASNSYGLDCDTTGQVLATLALVKSQSSVPGVMAAGVAWLLGMQNDDGGWPAFTHGLAGKPPGPYSLGLFPTPPSLGAALSALSTARLLLGDPSTEDLTGRVLSGLGAAGYRIGNPVVDRAVAFLRAQIFDSGVWWGRWECNYLPGTAYVLGGLAAVGESPSADYVRRAVAWVESHQNPDGGFGEAIDSYANLALAGRGESTPYTTGLVLSALVKMRGAAAVIERAVAYLCRSQRADGLWSGGSYQIVLNTPLPFYKMPANVWTAPLMGLADYVARGGDVRAARFAPASMP